MKPDNIKQLRVLCLSLWTPPVIRPQATLIGKMIPEWLKQGVKPVIVTYDVCGPWEIEVPIYKIPQYKTSGSLASVPFIRNIFEYLYYRKICNILKPIAKKHDVDIIYSFANPQDSNIIGAMLKKQTGLKFISHFSDPWYNNPYKKLSRLGSLKALFLEYFIIKNSDRVTTVDPAMKDFIVSKYSAKIKSKFVVVNHCFSPNDYLNINKAQNDSFIFSHIGIIYKTRTPEILFKAVKKLLQVEPQLKQRIGVNLIGGINSYTNYSLDQLKQLIKNYNLTEIVKVVAPVSYEESLKQMKLSDCLVVIDGDFPYFIASKVVDYAGSGSFILGLTPSNSSTHQFLTNLGYPSFNYSQIDEMSRCINDLILGKLKPKVNKDFLNKFDVKNTTVDLIKQFKTVLNI